MVALATAHPAKFPDAVAKAAGQAPGEPRAVKAMAKKPEQIDRMPANLEAVKAYVRDFAQA
jgi:threonine synthase